MPKRMTQLQRNQIADELLCAAKHWQMNKGRRRCCSDHMSANEIFDHTERASEYADYRVFTVEASAALSEAARLADTELVDAETGE